MSESAAQGPGEQFWHTLHAHHILLWRGLGGDKANCGDSWGWQEEVVRIKDGRKGVSGKGGNRK